ncbi:response regulator transcription factor [Actinophytocola sediminis]
MRILVVDDDERLASLVKRGLEAEGFAVDLAFTGTDGLWLAREHDYDALVLDVMLPGLNGYRVCAQLREEGRWTPILMLTAKDGEFDQAEGLDAGADDYLTKPFSYVVLAARVRALLRRARISRPGGARIRLGDLEVDPAAARCLRAGTEISLTAKEFAILEYLASRAGHAVSKTAIIENVWDFAFDGDVNTVEAHVSKLRRKIDTAFGRRAIETLRGIGYRLAADGG